MAAITSNVNGVWSNTSVWVGGVVPVEGDTCTINHNVEIDQSITVGADSAVSAITINTGKTLLVPNTVAGNYSLTCKGNFTCNGTFSVGTVAGPLPANRTFTWILNYSATMAEQKYNALFLTGSSLILQGAARTYDRCYLAADIAPTPAGNTVTTDISTGWVTGDEVAFAATYKDAANRFKRTLTADASGTTLTLASNPPTTTYGYSGTSPSAGEVILLSRNIIVKPYNQTDASAAANFACGIRVSGTATANIDWTQFRGMGFSTFPALATPTSFAGTIALDHVAIVNTDGIALQDGAATTGTWTVTDLVGYQDYLNTTSAIISFLSTATSTGWHTFLRCWLIGGYDLFSVSSQSASVTYCRAANYYTTGFLNGLGYRRSLFTNYPDGEFHHNTAHSGGGGTGIGGFRWTAALSWGYLHDLESYYNDGSGFALPVGTIVITNTTLEACSSWGHAYAGGSCYALDGLHRRSYLWGCSADSSTTAGHQPTAMVSMQSTYPNAPWCVVNPILSSGVAPKAPLTEFVRHYNSSVTGGILVNPTWGNTTGSEVRTGEILHLDDYRHRGNASGDHRFMKSRGAADPQRSATNVQQYDNVIFYTSRPALRCGAPGFQWDDSATLNSLDIRQRASGFKKGVPAGNTATFSVWVRKSISTDAGGDNYNGNQPRLIVLANDCGIKDDTVLDTMTAAVGNWEQLTGTTAAATTNGVMEVAVDYDGTTGWINVGDWS